MGLQPNRARFESWCENFACLAEGPGYSYEGHESLREPARALEGRHVVFQKSAQEGITTKILLNVFWLCLRLFTKGVGYAFPTEKAVARYSKTRVGDLYRANAHLGLVGREQERDSILIKPLGRTWIYFLGTESVHNLRSIPLDCVVLDEVSDIAATARRLFMERLEHSDFRFVRELSTPTFPEFGINAAFLESDQRVWVVVCPACRYDFNPEQTFPQCVEPYRDVARTRCPKCSKPVSFPEAGRWVAQSPTSKIVGFRVSRLNSARLQPDVLRVALTEWESGKNRQVLTNNFLGMPHLDVEAKLDREWLLSNQCGPGGEGSAQFVGMDVGVPFHACGIVKGAGDGVAIPYKRRFGSWTEVRNEIARTAPAVWGVDAGPETNAVRELVAQFPGRVYAIFYTDQRTPYRWDEERHEVFVNRTESLDASHRLLATKGLAVLPRRGPEEELFASHCANIARKLEVDEVTGSRRYVWAKLGEDHYRHAFNYALVVSSAEQLGPIETYRGGLLGR